MWFRILIFKVTFSNMSIKPDGIWVFPHGNSFCGLSKLLSVVGRAV